MLISFSGLDGAGKTTQIHLLTRFLSERGLDVESLEMNKNVSASNFLRETVKPILTGKPRRRPRQSVDAPPNDPIPEQYRYDKNRKETSRVLLRQATYVVDLVTLCLVRVYWEGLRRKIVVMDRYIYDSLANLHGTNKIAVGFMNLFARLAPAPTIAFFMDADPAVAFARKPEYPPDYYDERAVAYRDLWGRLRTGRTVKVTTIDQTQDEIREIVATSLNGKEPAER